MRNSIAKEYELILAPTWAGSVNRNIMMLRRNIICHQLLKRVTSNLFDESGVMTDFVFADCSMLDANTLKETPL